jgi:hypothetical protein
MSVASTAPPLQREMDGIGQWDVKKSRVFRTNRALSTGPVSTCADHFGTKLVAGTRSKPSGGVTTVTTLSRHGGGVTMSAGDATTQSKNPKENQTTTTKEKKTNTAMEPCVQKPQAGNCHGSSACFQAYPKPDRTGLCSSLHFWCNPLWNGL